MHPITNDFGNTNEGHQRPRRNRWKIWRQRYTTDEFYMSRDFYPHSHDTHDVQFQGQLNQYADGYYQADQNTDYTQGNQFDPFTTGTPGPSTNHNLDVYPHDHTGYGSAFLPNLNSHPILQHHHYAPLEPSREVIKPNQRVAKDLFLPENIRQRLHDKNEAFLRIFPNSTLPTIEYFHTLTPLQGSSHSSTARSSPINTVYKAVSERDGKTYCLRRIHNFQVTADTDHALRSVRSSWSRIRSSNIVSIHIIFTTSKFGDSSAIIVSDYHPASETVAEKYFNKPYPRPGRSAEDVIWGFVVQISNALKAIHSAHLAVGNIDKTKILVTDENRYRLSGCAIEDLVHRGPEDIPELQRQDIQQSGKVITDLAQSLASHFGAKGKGQDVLHRTYSKHLVEVFKWFTDHIHPDNYTPIDLLLTKITADTIDVFDATLRADDVLQATLNRELENSRLIRLMIKLNCLNERLEYEHDRAWSTHGSRAVLPLFQDYVFHQVDAQGRPVPDMGHMLACLNKLDVGIEEKVTLTGRDDQSVIVVSYKELKQTVENAWTDLMRRSAA